MPPWRIKVFVQPARNPAQTEPQWSSGSTLALFAPIHSPHSLEKILKISVIFYWSTESSVISFKSNYNMELLLPYKSVKALRWPQVFGDEPIEELMLW